MEEIAEGKLIPAWLQELLSLALTVLAAILYAAILGSAVVRTFNEGDPVFSQGTVRIASLLSGLVGSVVTAGFARGRRPISVPVSIVHPPGKRVPSGWIRLDYPTLAKIKLLGLAATLGLRIGPATPSLPSPYEEEGEEPKPGRKLSAAVWVALLYFAVYFSIGVSALVLTVIRPEVPELILNASWVWLGTVVSSGYTFFALSSRG